MSQIPMFPNKFAIFASILGVPRKYVVPNSRWLKITLTAEFGSAYLLGIDPSTGAQEVKLIIGRAFNGQMSIAGIQGRLHIKEKDNSYYISIDGGYNTVLSEIESQSATIEFVDNVPSDATDITIGS